MVMSWIRKVMGKPTEGGADTATVVPWREALDPWARTAWKPVTATEDGPADASKFSGTPWLQPGEDWPICLNCGQPMQLFLQLNARDLPAEAGAPWGEGLLQMFYCTTAEPHCESDCEAWHPFSPSVLLRVLPGAGDPAAPTRRPADPFPPERILGWEAQEDYPDGTEPEILGASLPDAEVDAASGAGFPRAGDKLGGWPHWVQDPEYPRCPDCDGPMEFLFQIDSEDHLPHMFGDAGCGHITRCPEHTERLAFGWACC